MQNPNVTYYPKAGIQKATEQFETPFFLYEEKKLRENCRNFRNAFLKYFPDFEALYAIKANPNPDVLRIIHDEGFGMDCSSESEAWISSRLGYAGMYTGNYTSESEFEYIMNKGLIINLDDSSMLPTIAKIGMPNTLSFRINPGIGKATIESNVFAGPDAKYGVPFEKAPEAYMWAKELGVKHFGIHMMTGSNVPIDEKDYFAEITRKLFEIVAQIKQKTGIEIEFMNIGGGFGVPYRPEKESLNMDDIAENVRGAFDESIKKFGLKEPRLMAEPGRYIGANAGWLVGRVTVIKDSYKKFVGIDASTNDMPRTAIYGAYHHISVINNSSENEEVAVVGRICENNDQFSKNIMLPKCAVGDIVLIHNCGAHAYSMGHNYNGRLRHAEYLLQLDGELKQIRASETIEDLFRNTNLAI